MLVIGSDEISPSASYLISTVNFRFRGMRVVCGSNGGSTFHDIFHPDDSQAEVIRQKLSKREILPGRVEFMHPDYNGASVIGAVMHYFYRSDSGEVENITPDKLSRIVLGSNRRGVEYLVPTSLGLSSPLIAARVSPEEIAAARRGVVGF